MGQLSRLMITPPARKISKKDEALLEEVRVGEGEAQGEGCG